MNATKRVPIPGWRTMTGAQRHNAKMDRIWEAAKDAKTQFNESSRTEQPSRPCAHCDADREGDRISHEPNCKTGIEWEHADIPRVQVQATSSGIRTKRILTDSELATILHALRVLQCAGRIEGCAAGLCEHFEDAEELNNAEIDELCESLNCGELALIEIL